MTGAVLHHVRIMDLTDLITLLPKPSPQVRLAEAGGHQGEPVCGRREAEGAGGPQAGGEGPGLDQVHTGWFVAYGGSACPC